MIVEWLKTLKREFWGNRVTWADAPISATIKCGERVLDDGAGRDLKVKWIDHPVVVKWAYDGKEFTATKVVVHVHANEVQIVIKNDEGWGMPLAYVTMPGVKSPTIEDVLAVASQEASQEVIQKQ
jgi:hypothetical protein